MRADYIIVGSGLTGATIARTLHDAGRDVLVVERRDHVGGNVHDHVHQPSGIRVHTYGPHYFRTSSLRIWEWAQRFADFYEYEACLLSQVHNRLEHWPITAEYMERAIGEDWRRHLPTFPASCPPANFEEASLAMIPRLVYERFVRGYTEKQWGVPAQSLSASLAKRFEVREDNDPRLSQHPWQGIPVGGYAKWTREILRGIPVAMGVDYLRERERWQARKLLVFTGPLDAFFNHVHGQLLYRGQQRHHVYHQQRGLAGDLVGSYFQEAGQVNFPTLDRPEIRALEWKHMLSPAEREEAYARRSGTVVTYETPYTPLGNGYSTPEQEDCFEYPFPSAEAEARANRYRARATALSDAIVCGRLGEYRYLDMDQAIARALVIAERILARG